MRDINRPLAIYELPRGRATGVGVVFGIFLGFGNLYLDITWPSTLEIVLWLLLSLATVLVLHEGLHGFVGRMLGHSPIYGIEPPLVFTTFDERISRNHFIVIALAPLIVLDAAALALYQIDTMRLFANLCFTVNTIGAIGDVWIVSKLARHDSGTFAQDTKSGVQIWATPL